MPAQSDFGMITAYLNIKDKICSGMYSFDEEFEVKHEAVDAAEEDDYLRTHNNNNSNSFLGMEEDTWILDPYTNLLNSTPTISNSTTAVAINNTGTVTAKGGAGKSFSLGAQGAGCTVIEGSIGGRLGEGDFSGGESSPDLFDLDKPSFYNDDHNTSSSSASSSCSSSNDFPEPRIKLEQLESSGFEGCGSVSLATGSEQSPDEMMQTLFAVDDVIEMSRNLGIPVNPNRWSHMDTQRWVLYMLSCNNYDEDCGALFSVEGEVLCRMRLSDFNWRSSHAGPFLYQNLNIWKLVSQMVPPTPVKEQPSAPMFSAHLNKTSVNHNITTTTTTTINHNSSMQVPAVSSSDALGGGYGTDPAAQDKLPAWFGSGGPAMTAPTTYPAAPPSVSPSPSMADSTSSADAFVVPRHGGSLTDEEMVMYSPDHHGQQTKTPYSSATTTTTTHHHSVNSNAQARRPHHLSGGLQHRNGSRLGKQTIHLWQFLRELLDDDNCGPIIRWLDRGAGIFKIEDSGKVAKLWGNRKNRPAMNYDKLSRSVRQYYKKGIIKKTEMSKRLVYQFCQPYL